MGSRSSENKEETWEGRIDGTICFKDGDLCQLVLVRIERRRCGMLFGSDSSGGSVRMSGDTEQNVRRRSLETLIARISAEDTEPGEAASRCGCIRRIIDPWWRLDRSGEERKKLCRTASASSPEPEKSLRARCFLVGLYGPSWAIKI